MQRVELLIELGSTLRTWSFEYRQQNLPTNVGHNLKFSLFSKLTIMKIEIGEVFTIKTEKGFGFIQYVGDST